MAIPSSASWVIALHHVGKSVNGKLRVEMRDRNKEYFDVDHITPFRFVMTCMYGFLHQSSFIFPLLGSDNHRSVTLTLEP
ncbi:uncharacterized protein G2W53_037710 [Senna tora]|uniref:Uncharacterized protein n=1 Tax=Senna tora TaxID=362788 RepID=A0A834W653_9FABA|nr:uncharacterized protein G2W53_037710 [Senna tora]